MMLFSRVKRVGLAVVLVFIGAAISSRAEATLVVTYQAATLPGFQSFPATYNFHVPAPPANLASVELEGIAHIRYTLTGATTVEGYYGVIPSWDLNRPFRSDQNRYNGGNSAYDAGNNASFVLQGEVTDRIGPGIMHDPAFLAAWDGNWTVEFLNPGMGALIEPPSPIFTPGTPGILVDCPACWTEGRPFAQYLQDAQITSMSVHMSDVYVTYHYWRYPKEIPEPPALGMFLISLLISLPFSLQRRRPWRTV